MFSGYVDGAYIQRESHSRASELLGARGEGSVVKRKQSY